MKRKALSSQMIRGSEFAYFDLQAYMGTTKHMGGLETTKELVELCHLDRGTYILDVGCGVGATACYLAQKYGSRVVGIDIHKAMIEESDKRAQRDGLEHLVEFQIADARHLPFEDALFDAVICESVATFIEDRRKVVSECARTVKLGGYVGFNEEIWLQEPPAEIVEFVEHTWDVGPDLPMIDGWIEFLKGAGLHNIVVRSYEFDARRESTQVKRYRFGALFKMFYRTLCLYLINPAFRKYMAERRNVPKDLFDYLGYAVLAGRK